jgi:murein L,D-transpeptidase YcbB/YkuD
MENPYAVYLHDSPERDLFAAARRTFSSGCVRLERASELARLILEREGWSTAAIEAALAGRRQRRLELTTAVPVSLRYFTAWVAADGELHFRRDVYRRDRE